MISKVLIANRGEIAVRIARAAKDAGITSVAVYAEPDRDALHVKLADEAYSLGGKTPKDSYLDVEKIIAVAKKSGADAVHPGYGFLAENSAFAEAVYNAGITWVGPSPASIDALGDKVSSRHIAERAGAPLVAGTKDPVNSAEEIEAFAEEHGFPIAIKAAFGGGGRGLKVVHQKSEIAELFESAVREATAAFGRGECFVEKFLDAPRHVETQCLADQQGNVVIVSTRDCSLQRRNQKLVEEAPAPFLTAEQREILYSSSKAILKEANYHGAGTCEFLIGRDGTVSFLEVNTRLQVEHPVTEEITGIDLVREQFKIADGHPLEFNDPSAERHSIEFRINGEDAGNNFLPHPGKITEFKAPSGPGVRVDTGVASGDSIDGNFDSMLAKLIVTGKTRQEALQRARRALDEFTVKGIPTVLPFHRSVVSDEAFAPQDPTAPFAVHTTWIETEYSNQIPAWKASADHDTHHGEDHRQSVVVEVGGKRLEVTLPSTLGISKTVEAARKSITRKKKPRKNVNSASGDTLTSPMQGTIVKVAVENGATVQEGDLIVVLEAMKMEQPINAHRSGKIDKLTLAPGDAVVSGAEIADIIDA